MRRMILSALLLTLLIALAGCATPEREIEIVNETVVVPVTVIVTLDVTAEPPPTHTPCPTLTPYPTYTPLARAVAAPAPTVAVPDTAETVHWELNAEQTLGGVTVRVLEISLIPAAVYMDTPDLPLWLEGEAFANVQTVGVMRVQAVNNNDFAAYVFPDQAVASVGDEEVAIEQLLSNSVGGKLEPGAQVAGRVVFLLDSAAPQEIAQLSYGVERPFDSHFYDLAESDYDFVLTP